MLINTRRRRPRGRVDVIRIEAQAAPDRGVENRSLGPAEFASMMRQSSAGRYDGAPLICRPAAGTGGSARPEQILEHAATRARATAPRHVPHPAAAASRIAFRSAGLGTGPVARPSRTIRSWELYVEALQVSLASSLQAFLSS